MGRLSQHKARLGGDMEDVGVVWIVSMVVLVAVVLYVVVADTITTPNNTTTTETRRANPIIVPFPWRIPRR